MTPRWALAAAATVTLAATLTARQERPGGDAFSFRTAVELVNVTVTVTDGNGRFVSGLRQSDFQIYEDGQPQTIQQFDSERVPVSLGIALDTSGSMYGEKIAAAQAALHRFLFDLLGDQDEVFLYRFDGKPQLIQDWTSNLKGAARALGAIAPSGGTALYDTVAQAVPLAQTGSRRKKALVVISDGNDTSSRTHAADLTPLIRGTDVLVYAVGIDASDNGDYEAARPTGAPKPAPVPSPFPGSHPGVTSTNSGGHGHGSTGSSSVDRINAAALRQITDDSGGRTEVVVSTRDLDPATANIADELSRQYFIGYGSTLPKDGRWHTIEVRLARQGSYTVRARKGYIAN